MVVCRGSEALRKIKAREAKKKKSNEDDWKEWIYDVLTLNSMYLHPSRYFSDGTLMGIFFLFFLSLVKLRNCNSFVSVLKLFARSSMFASNVEF